MSKGSPVITKYKLTDKGQNKTEVLSFRDGFRGMLCGLSPFDNEQSKLTRMRKVYPTNDGHLIKRKSVVYNLSIEFCDCEHEELASE